MCLYCHCKKICLKHGTKIIWLHSFTDWLTRPPEELMRSGKGEESFYVLIMYRKAPEVTCGKTKKFQC